MTGEEEDDEQNKFQRRMVQTISTGSITDRERDQRDRDRDSTYGRSRSRGRTPSDSPQLTQKINPTTNSNSMGMGMTVRPVSAYVTQAFEVVTERFQDSCCEVQGLLESALGADPTNFKKVSNCVNYFIRTFFAIFILLSYIRLF